MISISRILNSLFMLLLLGLPLQASELHAEPAPMIVSKDMQLTRGAIRLETLMDTEGKYSFDTIREPSISSQFQPISKNSVKDLPGVSWYRGILDNPSAQTIVLHFQFYMASHTEMALYPEDATIERQFFEAGWKKAFHTRDIPSLYPTFEFKIPPGRSQILIRSDGPLFTFSMGSKTAVSENSAQFETILTFCLAAFLTLGIFNLFIFTRTQDRSYLYYFIRCLSAIGISVVYYGVLMKFFLPEIAFKPHALMSTMTSIDTFCWIFVARRFLSLEKFGNRKIVNGITWLLSGSLIISAIFPWVFPNQRPDALFGILGPLTFFTGVGTGIFMSFRRYRPAYFFLLASAFNLAGVVIIVLALYGPGDPTMFTDLGPCVSGVFEGLLLAFGLGDKYMMYMNAANAALNQKNVELDRNLTFMFQKLDQGIFSIDENGTISNEHSDYLKTILNNENLGGKNAFQMLFNQSELSTDAIDQIRNATFSSVGEDVMAYDLNSHLFPRDFTRNTPKGPQVIEMDWQPLINSNEKCEKMMIVLRDVSSIRALQKESESNQKNFRIAAQILAITLPNYRKYADNAASLLDKNLREIESFTKSLSSLNLPLLFRNIHTIKGNARTFGLLYIAEAAHEVENYFSDLRTGKVRSPDPEKLMSDLRLLQSVHSEYEEIIVDVLKFDSKSNTNDPIELLNNLYQEYRDEEKIKEIFFQLGSKQRMSRFYPTIEEMLVPVLESQKKLAAELAKPTPSFIFHGNGIRLSIEMETVLRNIFTQILRNSIDHGVELPVQRMQEGKMINGIVEVTIDVEVANNQLVIEIYDDGAGLNLTALAKKSNLFNLSDQELAEIIFQTGVSTAEKVTHISGRGVGMDIIRELIVNQGGRIDIVFTQPRLETGRRPFKLVIKFPSDYLLENERRSPSVVRSLNVG